MRRNRDCATIPSHYFVVPLPKREKGTAVAVPCVGGGRDSSRVQRGGAKQSEAIRYFVVPLPKPVVRRSNTEQIKKTPFCGVLLFATFRQAALWRRQRDSNPRGLSPKRFSSFIPRLLSFVCYCCLAARIVGKSAF